MRETGKINLLAAWILFLLAAPLSFLWLRPSLSGSSLEIFTKLLLIDACAAALAILPVQFAVARRRTAANQLLSFASALPSAETNLPEAVPIDLSELARAIKLMSVRVQTVVDRSNLELARREAILACMAEGVLAVDASLKVVFCNDAFAQAFQTRVPVSEGRILYEVVREPLIREILERVILTGVPETDRFQLPSAAGRWFEVRALPFSQQPGRGAVIVLHDVTDIQRQEQMRKDFVADVSHEFRTPLAAIRGYAETLLDGALDDPDNNRRFVEIIQLQAIRLNNIASDLLVLSELDTDTSPASPSERIELRSVVHSALHTVEAQAAVRGVTLDTAKCCDCIVVGYRFRLEQVIVNLLDNAVKFNRPEGQVFVECSPLDNGQVQLSISDTGIGIPSEDLKRVFERFYRVDRARSRPAGGTGLGLPIVKQVVEKMGGTVSVESQLGRGSRFTILLKAA